MSTQTVILTIPTTNGNPRKWDWPMLLEDSFVDIGTVARRGVDNSFDPPVPVFMASVAVKVGAGQSDPVEWDWDALLDEAGVTAVASK